MHDPCKVYVCAHACPAHCFQCGVLGCVRAVFLCLLFLQIADVDVFFCVLLVIGVYLCDK